MAGKLTILIGPARSGKSTFAKKWIEVGPDSDWSDYTPRVVVNADSIRLALHGQRFLMEKEDEVHKTAHLMIKTLYLQGYSVLIDETNTTAKNIRKWLKIDNNAEIVFLNTSLEECERRAYATNQADLVEKGVIRRMFENLEKFVVDNHPIDNNVITYILNPENVYKALENFREKVKRGQ